MSLLGHILSAAGAKVNTEKVGLLKRMMRLQK